MAIVGVYTVQEREYSKDPEDRIWERNAAFDTDRGVWLATSDGRITDDFDPETIVDMDAEELIDHIVEVSGSSRTSRVICEDDIPGQIEVLEPVAEPSVDLLEETEE